MSDKSFVKLQNYATVCYDHTITNLTILMSHLFDVSDTVYKLQAKSLTKIIYKVQTASKISSITYSNTKIKPLH